MPAAYASVSGGHLLALAHIKVLSVLPTKCPAAKSMHRTIPLRIDDSVSCKDASGYKAWPFVMLQGG